MTWLRIQEHLAFRIRGSRVLLWCYNVVFPTSRDAFLWSKAVVTFWGISDSPLCHGDLSIHGWISVPFQAALIEFRKTCKLLKAQIKSLGLWKLCLCSVTSLSKSFASCTLDPLSGLERDFIKSKKKKHAGMGPEASQQGDELVSDTLSFL